jgi:hypothetical protein
MDTVILPGTEQFAPEAVAQRYRDVAKVVATGRLPARKLTDRLPTFAIFH